jgi:uncharacterized protein involved in exopolysaccharide biosynthesis
MDKIEKIEPDEISVKELVRKLKSTIRYLANRRTILLWFCFSGFLIGIVYSLIEKPEYIAVSTFVLQESGRGGGMGLSQYSNLASLAGIDLGSGSEKGLFQGDNILELYKSRLMIQKTLLTEASISGKKQLLIERYIQSNHSWLSWENNDKMEKMDFNINPNKFSRDQDSVLREIIKDFNKKILTVNKPDKKLSILSVEVKFKDELFAQIFNQTLVQNVNNFYVQTQTSKTYKSVQVLQHQADSVRTILNSSLGRAAATSDAIPNANPILHTLQVPLQKKQIDVQANSAIYAEIVKNLEVSKISLRQETPLIQLIDEPILPLEIDKPGKIKSALIGLIAGLFSGIFYLAFARLYVYLRNA